MGKRSRSSIGTREFDILIEVLAAARDEAKLSQNAVSKFISNDRTMYGRIERGERVIDVVEFVKVAQALGKDPLELLGTYLVRVQRDRITQPS